MSASCRRRRRPGRPITGQLAAEPSVHFPARRCPLIQGQVKVPNTWCCDSVLQKWLCPNYPCSAFSICGAVWCPGWSQLAWVHPTSGPPSHLHWRHAARPFPHPPSPLRVRAPRGREGPQESPASPARRRRSAGGYRLRPQGPVACGLLPGPPDILSPPHSVSVHTTSSLYLHKPETRASTLTPPSPSPLGNWLPNPVNLKS